MQERVPEDILILIGSTLIILILVIVVISAVIISQKRKFRHRQQLDQLRHENEKEILKIQYEIQTETFADVSRELHDNVSNTISLAILNLNLLPNQAHAVAQQQVDQARLMMLEAKNAVKDFSWSIHPDNLVKDGLSEALRALTEKFGRPRTIETEFVQSGQEWTLKPSDQIIIYRIVQEALGNVIKHARCTKAKVVLAFDDMLLRIGIHDNGRGFEPGSVMNAPGDRQNAGIRNMISRASLIGAKLSIESSPGNGTNVTLEYTPGNNALDQHHKYGIKGHSGNS